MRYLEAALNGALALLIFLGFVGVFLAAVYVLFVAVTYTATAYSPLLGALVGVSVIGAVAGIIEEYVNGP